MSGRGLIDLTFEQETTIRREHFRGTPYRDIAVALGMSRASVARRILRLGLQQHIGTARTDVRQTVGATVSARPMKEPRVHKPPRQAMAPKPPPPPPRPARKPGRIELQDLEWGECRWPTGDWPPYLFCGNPVIAPGMSWCGDHAKRVFSASWGSK